MTGVTWTRDFPKSNYEIRLEAMRVEGSDFFCGLTFPYQKAHATLVLGGQKATGGDLDHGYFYQPTIFTNVKPGSRLEQEEIFGPVLSVIKVKDAYAAAQAKGATGPVLNRVFQKGFQAAKHVRTHTAITEGQHVDDQAVLAARHGQVHLRQKFGVKQGPVQGAP